jgi:hypothetical protein
MPQKSSTTCAVLHLRLKLRVQPEVLLGECREAATQIAAVEGLIWKIWLFREQEFEIAGTYLFANHAAAEAYLNHPVIQTARSNPAVVSMQSQLWEIESSLSALTRAPLPDISAQHSELFALLEGGR